MYIIIVMGVKCNAAIMYGLPLGPGLYAGPPNRAWNHFSTTITGVRRRYRIPSGDSISCMLL